MSAQQTGLTVRVITGAEEARLIFLGVRHSMALPDQPTLVVDVGGGSVELIVGNRRDHVFMPRASSSAPSDSRICIS